MSPDAPLPVLPTVDKRAKARRAADNHPDALLGWPDGTAELARHVSTIPMAPEVHRLADVARALPKVVTVHERYGQPPGDLAYTAVADWTEEQAVRGAAWLANHRGAEWWALQAQAQREAVNVNA